MKTYHADAFRRGQVLLATVNEQTMVPFVSQQLNNLELALSLAKRGNLPGAEALVGQDLGTTNPPPLQNGLLVHWKPVARPVLR